MENGPLQYPQMCTRNLVLSTTAQYRGSVDPFRGYELMHSVDCVEMKVKASRISRLFCGMRVIGGEGPQCSTVVPASNIASTYPSETISSFLLHQIGVLPTHRNVRDAFRAHQSAQGYGPSVPRQVQSQRVWICLGLPGHLIRNKGYGDAVYLYAFGIRIA
jgi:hypothetical protein